MAKHVDPEAIYDEVPSRKARKEIEMLDRIISGQQLIEEVPHLLSSSVVVCAVVEAWMKPGPVPKFHNQEKDKLRKTWPVLANALDGLAQTMKQGDLIG